MKMKLMLSICVSLFAANLVLVAQEKLPQEIKQKFSYKSDGFSCVILPSGVIKNISINNKVLIADSQIYGKYHIIDGEKHDARFFQTNDKGLPIKAAMKILEKDDNTYILQQEAFLSNKKYTNAAKYIERITLSPRKITVDVSLTLMIPLASKATIFSTLNNLPSKTFISKTANIEFTNETTKELNFTQEPIKKNFGRVKNMKIPLGEETFIIAAGDKSQFKLSDTRTYGGKSFRIDMFFPLPWNKKPVTSPKDKTFSWSFTLKLTDK